MDTLDLASLTIVFVGLVVSSVLLALAAADWFRHHDHDDMTEALRAAVILIVWLGFTATLVGRLLPEHLVLMQWVALGSRLALLAMVLWLVTQRHRGSKAEGHLLVDLRSEVRGLKAEVADLRVEVRDLKAEIVTRDERIATLTAEAVAFRLAAKEG